MIPCKNVVLNNGVAIPQFGLGVFLSEVGETTAQAVQWALEAGYRHIDTAAAYENEADVAEGIRRSGVPREEIFITTKCPTPGVREQKSKEWFENSLKLLKTDYVDLYLIHWPAENYDEAYENMMRWMEEGKIRAICCSNFHIRHLQRLESLGYTTPAVNQIELHPSFQNREVENYCKARGIVIEAWSPLGGQDHSLIGDPRIQAIAKKHGKTGAQVILRWHLQLDHIIFPKSVHKERIIENAQIFDFALDAEDIAAIAAMDTNKRSYWSPDRYK